MVAKSDPSIPVVDYDNPIVNQLTDAQAAGVLAAMTLDDSSGSSERRTLGAPRAVMTGDGVWSPKAWRVAIGLASVAALVYLCLAIWFVPRWAANGVKSSNPAAQSAARADERGSVRTAMLAVLAGGIAAAGAVYTGRTFALNKREAARTFELNRRGQITERFHRAVELLGHQHANARVGGIYSLEQIAHDSAEDHHGPIIELLAAYIRASAPIGDDAEPRAPSVGKARPTPDVQSALTVLARRKSEHDDPQTQIRLSDVYLRGATLRGGIFDRARFRRAVLRDARLEGTRLRDAIFGEAHLQGAHFHADAELALEAADLRGTRFPNAHLEGAHLQGAHLEGANLTGANLEGANLRGATLQGAIYDRDSTIWPKGFDPAAAGAVPRA